MSDTKKLVETFTGRIHQTPSGSLLSVWQSANGGYFYRDRVELTLLKKNATKGTKEAETFTKAITAIENFKPPGYWMR